MNKKLHIGGIPNDANEMSLAQLVGIHGDIDTLKIVRDRQIGKNKGYAFVEMVSEDGASAVATALNQTTWGERILDIKPAGITDTVQPPIRYERVQRRGEPEKRLRPRRSRI